MKNIVMSITLLSTIFTSCGQDDSKKSPQIENKSQQESKDDVALKNPSFEYKSYFADNGDFCTEIESSIFVDGYKEEFLVLGLIVFLAANIEKKSV